MWASEEVCAGIYTLLCMLGPLIKRDTQKEKECDQEVKVRIHLKYHEEKKHDKWKL